MDYTIYHSWIFLRSFCLCLLCCDSEERIAHFIILSSFLWDQDLLFVATCLKSSNDLPYSKTLVYSSSALEQRPKRLGCEVCHCG